MIHTVIFDLDGTLVQFPTGTELLPYRAQKLAELSKNNIRVAIATNQAGVTCRIRGEEEDWKRYIKYPTMADWAERREAISITIDKIVGYEPIFLYCFYWPKNPIVGVDELPEWSEHWRKPQPGMLKEIMRRVGDSDPSHYLMVGDSYKDAAEDRLAAFNAGIKFVRADEYFKP